MKDKGKGHGWAYRVIRIALCALVCSAVTAAGAEVTATLDPAQVSVGESVQLTVMVSGSQSAAPSLPAVAGLDFQNMGQSTQIQIINGAMTAESAHTYLVTPRQAGTFTIPPIEAGGAKSNPMTLRVLAGSGAARPAQRGTQTSPGASLPPPNVKTAPVSVSAPEDARFGFMQIGVPKKEFYVGELVPVEVGAYFPEGLQASVTGLPTLSSEAFTLNKLEQPERTEKVVNRRNFMVLTWHSTISAVKAGDYSLGAQMPATIVVREQAERRSGSLFDDFFDDPAFGFGGGQQKEVTLQSDPAAVKVMPLPVAGRPKNFSGGVGTFDVEATASTDKAAVGDPITLTLKITGGGNFDRIFTDMIASAEGWKTYKPKSTFEPADSAGYQGTKKVEQILIPNDPALTAIPAISFSFFDPETKRYVTRTTKPIPLTVSGIIAKANVAQASASSSPLSATPPAQDLVPNKTESGRAVSTLRPVFLHPWFALAQAVAPLALIAALLFLRRKNRLATDPKFARAAAAEHEIRDQLEEMDRAMRKHEPLAFFDSARHALQQRLAERWDVRPESITVAEVSARANGEAEGVRAVFEIADRLRFSGETFAETDFRRWKKQVEEELKYLKK